MPDRDIEIENRRQKTEDRGQKAENGGPVFATLRRAGRGGRMDEGRKSTKVQRHIGTKERTTNADQRQTTEGRRQNRKNRGLYG